MDADLYLLFKLQFENSRSKKKYDTKVKPKKKR